MTLHQSIRRQFGLPLVGIDAHTAVKGEGVFRAGRVRWVRAGDDAVSEPRHPGAAASSADGNGSSTGTATEWKLQAQVLGSNGESYRTRVALSRRLDALQASSTCTCPVSVHCKHAAAALLAWLASTTNDQRDGQHDDDQTAARRSRALFQRQHALHWARELATVKIAGSGAARRTHLLYVLQIHDRVAQLSVFRIRQTKDASFAPPERYLSLVEHAFNPPVFWEDVDAAVAHTMLQETKLSSSGFSLAGPRSREALLALADAGRLYLDEPPQRADQPALRPGPDLPARLAWLPHPGDPMTGDELPLRLGIEVSSPATPIYCAAPCYLDRESGTIGTLALEQPTTASMMQWLRNAPPVPPEAAAEVAIALHATLHAKPTLQERLPELPAHPVREAKESPRFVLGLFSTGSAPLPRNRQASRAGGRTFMAVSLAVEYAGQRIEPLRRTTMGLQTDAGPVLVICDRDAEQAALTQLRDAIADVARDEPGLSLAAEPGKGGNVGGASSGWLTVAALPADGVAAARIKHELALSLQAQGWIVLDHSELATSVIRADDVVVELRPASTTTPGSRAPDSDAPDPDATDLDGTDSDATDSNATDPVASGPAAPRTVVADADADATAGGVTTAGADTRAAGRRTPDWFDLQTGFQVGDRRIDLAPLLASIVAAGGFDAWRASRCPQGVFWMKISDTEVLRLDARRIEPLARVVADWAQLRDSGEDEPSVLVSPFAAAQLANVAGEAALPESVRKLREWFHAFEGLRPAQAPETFKASLRPYQQDGLAWLQFLAKAGLGGILADDMGLGKTIQMLAHVDLERSAGRLVDPVLVVAPTSVIFNWQSEARRHAPSLRVLALTGLGRSKRFGEIGSNDLVLTSYALLPRDAAVLREQPWHAIILDEAQMIKNPRTLGAAAVRRLSANHRFALTGTPLENHLGELWSIMQFVLPGLLGPDESFRSRFRTPIERQPGTELAAERLRALEARVRPFMLRRTKQSVLADLPPRTEIIQRVELPSEQRDLYESIRAAMDKRVREALSRAGLARSQIVLLDALLKLRQACCDPALVKLPGARQVTRSAKRDALIELLATLVDEGRKALVFSQFTSMLDLIEAAIDADPRLAKVPRARLDGDTIDRGGAVEQFQEGDAQLFLLSLKAGGVGLNLTAADTVIHYDPWWNPAVENQATDRAHRIGQEKPVFVHKLIAAGTVEERILALQARKAELAAAVLSGSLTAVGGKALSQEDLLGLFEPL